MDLVCTMISNQLLPADKKELNIFLRIFSRLIVGGFFLSSPNLILIQEDI